MKNRTLVAGLILASLVSWANAHPGHTRVEGFGWYGGFFSVYKPADLSKMAGANNQMTKPKPQNIIVTIYQ
jgi:hypothetical protein